MPSDNNYESTDKAAAILLGVPLLAGVILLVLALASPGSAPYRSRATVAPIAIALILVGVIGGALYVRWRLRRQRADKLDAMALAGAFRLAPPQRTPRLIQISHAIADELALPPLSCVLPSQSSTLTAAHLLDAVYTAVRRLQSRGEMLIDPGGVKLAAVLVLDFARAGSGLLGMTTDLNRAIPMRHRRALARSVRQRTGVALPPLTLPNWASGLAILLAIALTFGITVPLAQWADRAHAIDTDDSLVRILARLIVRGGFFAILIGAVVGLILLFRILFPSFPKGCRTVGHLSAYLPREPAALPESLWTKELVWTELRRIIARSTNTDEHSIRPHSVCH